MSSIFQLASASDRPRLRPGERPCWLDATADRAAFDEWRRGAAEAALTVDAWVALLLELDLVLEDLRPLGGEELLRSAVGVDPVLRHLCSSEALRGWPAPIASPHSAHDDLPELLLSERLALRLRPGAPLSPRIRPQLFELAEACERRAASQCRTLEGWALSTVIADLPRPRAFI